MSIVGSVSQNGILEWSGGEGRGVEGREREGKGVEERKREQGKMKKDVMMTSCSKLGDHCFNLKILWTITL